MKFIGVLTDPQSTDRVLTSSADPLQLLHLAIGQEIRIGRGEAIRTFLPRRTNKQIATPEWKNEDFRLMKEFVTSTPMLPGDYVFAELAGTLLVAVA